MTEAVPSWRDSWLMKRKAQDDENSLPKCALEGPSCSICKGKGTFWKAEGAVAVAALCSCIKDCPECRGGCQRTVNGLSVRCRSDGISPITLDHLSRTAGVPARYAQSDLRAFKNFGKHTRSNGKALRDQLISFVQDFGKRPSQNQKGLLISGSVGSGKTYLLSATAKELLQKGIRVRMTDFFQLVSELKAGFSDSKNDTLQLLPLIDVDVLIIDELGKGRCGDYEQTVLDQLVCGRYNQNKIILASTNYALAPRGQDYQLTKNEQSFREDFSQSLESRVGPRIFSRFVETMSFFTLMEEDFRTLKSKDGAGPAL